MGGLVYIEYYHGSHLHFQSDCFRITTHPFGGGLAVAAHRNIRTRCIQLIDSERPCGSTVVMAATRECGCFLSADSSISALVQDCPLQKTWFPQTLAPEGVTRSWNNMPLTGQGSNSATCRTRRVSLRRSGHVVSRAVGRVARKPFVFLVGLSCVLVLWISLLCASMIAIHHGIENLQALHE